MLTSDTLNAFVQRDTKVVADALIGGSILGTQCGDRVLATAQNYPDHYLALVTMLRERGAWEVAA